jgi:hypothetical protein
MQASHVLVRVCDGRLWEANQEMSDLLSLGAPDGMASEFWRSGEMAVWHVDGAWTAACRGAKATGLASFEEAARHAVVLEGGEGEALPLPRSAVGAEEASAAPLRLARGTP